MGDEKLGSSEIVEVPDGSYITHFRKAVKEACKRKLTDYDANDLYVYPSGTVVPVESGTLPIGSGKPVPTGTTDEKPLVVIAPQQQRQQIGTCL